MKKIAIIGGPSAGKTLVALAVGIQLKLRRFIVRFVLEYATEYIIRNGNPKNVFEQMAIFCGQRDEEWYKEELPEGDFLVTDAASFLACIYARHFRPKADAGREEIQKYNYVIKTLDKWARERTLSTYDYVFLVPLEFGFQKDGIRWQADEKESKKIADEIESFLKVERKQYYCVSGSLEERVGKILAIIMERENGKEKPNFSAE